MNTVAIKKEIFFAPFGYSLFGEHVRYYNPFGIDEHDDSLFGITLTTYISSDTGEIIISFDTNRCEHYDGNAISTTAEIVDSILEYIRTYVRMFGEDMGCSESDLDKYEPYFRTYFTNVINSEYELATLVREEMKKSDLFKVK